MTDKQKLIMEGNQNNIIIYTTADGKASVNLMTQDGNVWMNSATDIPFTLTANGTSNANVTIDFQIP